MPLTKMQVQPGIYKDDTVYSQEGKYVDADKIRFTKGRAEKIGGWAKLDTDTITSGVVRTLLPYYGTEDKIRAISMVRYPYLQTFGNI